MVCQLRKAWNACQADVEACMKCEIWLETSPYKHQPKQMTKYEVEVPKRATEAINVLPKIRGWQSNPQNKAGRPIRFHRGDPSHPMSQTVYCTCPAVLVPGAHVHCMGAFLSRELWMLFACSLCVQIFACSWSISAFFDLNVAFLNVYSGNTICSIDLSAAQCRLQWHLHVACCPCGCDIANACLHVDFGKLHSMHLEHYI